MKKKMRRGSRSLMTGALFAVLLAWLPLAGAQAQHEEEEDDTHLINTDHDRVLKLNPLQLGEVSVAYEKVRTARVSNEIGLSYIYRTFLNEDAWVPTEKRVHGIGIRMSQRKYTKKNIGHPFGFFRGFVFGYRFMLFEKDVFGLPEQDPGDPDYRFIGRLYQNSLDLSYQVGGQFKLSKHLTAEAAGALGVRAKYALATNAGDLIAERMVGHMLAQENSSALFVVPLPQLKLTVGYSF
ncbi:ABC transporter ATP-binding protein [Pontibacter sp. E15-1]|uniref:ABC transporter ATP-binding protein n=1 Tax=Pontibacter sp. E15-1 TaxID=2919918 RepID=UPI001F4FBC5C|nr:ABC transporter ATP-binding protein [Pontibacter sp. E15-1]MCJ8165386.1 ABC transporter ATP-binding protein [Pontibacter sp. E15-1]